MNLLGYRLSNLSTAAISPPPAIEEMIMTRVNYLLMTAACIFAVAFGTPALALNPQPLPPGFKAYVSGKVGQGLVLMRKAGGSQFRR